MGRVLEREVWRHVAREGCARHTSPFQHAPYQQLINLMARGRGEKWCSEAAGGAALGAGRFAHPFSPLPYELSG